MKKSLVLQRYKREFAKYFVTIDYQFILFGIYDELDDEMKQLYGFIRYYEKKLD